MSVFDHAVQKADEWIHDAMRELGTDDPREAHRALKAGLQALRDRLGVDEAAQLGAQLPLLVRGLFYEDWHPASTPALARTAEEILNLVKLKAGEGKPIDPERAVAALFEVLRRHVSPGALASLAQVLPQSLAQLSD